MGEAKRRGTFDERKEAATKRERIHRAGVVAGRRSIGKPSMLSVMAMLATMPLNSTATEGRKDE